VSNSQGEQTQGGSTITQQLVKLRLLSPEQTLQRKIKEVIVAILAEGIYEKDQILEMYLNQVPYGGSTYGIEEASQKYFGKSAKNLDLAESALIAGLPAAPSAYTPFGSNPEFAKNRQLEVLRRMVEDGYISEEQAYQAGAQELQFATNTIDIEAPHFVMYVRDLLEEEYGPETLYRGGLEIRTTLDSELQAEVQEKVTSEVDRLASLRVSNGAALVTNPTNGEIYAMVGSTDYFDFEHDGQVNVTTRPRQPGSSIKPLTYALALEKGSTVTTLIDDQPITYEIAGSKPYSPKNYDGKYHGKVTLKEALASSYNIPAVKLLNQLGVNTLIDKAEEMGITTWGDRRRFGLSLTLGGGEVLMTDMAKMYGAFANEGYVTDLNPILEIRNYKGETLYQNTCALENEGCFRQKALDSRVAYLISNILSDNSARIPAFGPQSTLYIPNQQVAVKTGTTNNMRDNWTFGYTSDRLVSVWVGNNDNQPMSYVASGVTGASSIWNDIMVTILDEEKPHAFEVPPGLVQVAQCIQGENKSCRGCNSGKVEYYVAGTEPKGLCNVAQNQSNTDASLEEIRRNRL
jgi:penicillin-binding protein 1C